MKIIEVRTNFKLHMNINSVNPHLQVQNQTSTYSNKKEITIINVMKSSIKSLKLTGEMHDIIKSKRVSSQSLKHQQIISEGSKSNLVDF